MSPLFRARTPKSRFLLEPEHLSALVWLALSLALAIISMAAPEFGRTIKSGILSFITPVVDIIQAPVRALSGGASGIAEMTKLRSEASKLRADNDRLMAWYHAAKRLEAENAQLRESARRIDDPKATFVTARVVMDQDQAYLRTALIAAGRKEGIEPGQAVLDGNALIGRVLETSDKAARLLLVSDASSRIPVMIEETGQRAILAGTNKDTPELQFVPGDVRIADGARVVTSGHGGIFPPYLPVGVVKRADKDYKVILFADLAALDLVRIVNYRLTIDLPVARSKSAPAQMTDLPGNKKEETDQTATAEASETEEVAQ